MSSKAARELSGMFGPILIGLVISALLSGITIVQVITFTKHSRKDHWGQKLTVYFLWVLDILHVSVTVHILYHYLVSHPGDVLVVWSLPVQPLIHVIILPTSHWIYIARIWKITTRKCIPVVLGLLVTANLAIGLFVGIKVFQSPNLAAIRAIPVKPELVLVLVMSAGINILIALSLGCALAKARTNLHWTNSSSTMLLAYLVNTGAIVSVVSTAVLITFVVSKNSLIFLGIETVSSRLYVNCLLAMLNSRHYFQSDRASTTMPLLLPSDTTSERDQMDVQPPRLAKTINEVGFPLFRHSTKAEDIKMLEVVVKQEAHSSKA